MAWIEEKPEEMYFGSTMLGTWVSMLVFPDLITLKVVIDDEDILDEEYERSDRILAEKEFYYWALEVSKELVQQFLKKRIHFKHIRNIFNDRNDPYFH